MFFSNSVIFSYVFLCNHFKLGKLQEKLLGADVFKLDGGFGIIASAFDAEDFSTTKAVVEDEDPFFQSFPFMGRKTLR